jgi:IS1 family transposase
LTLQFESWEQAHDSWLEPRDRIQEGYERLRRAHLDGRARFPQALSEVVGAHGLAGLFLRPEHILRESRPPSRMGRRDTAFHHTRLREDTFASIAVALAEGVGVSSAARIFGTSKKTVLYVLARAGDHAAQVSRAHLRNVVVRECQLDELWSFIGKKQHNLEPVEALHGVLGDAWTWIAFDAVHKIVLAHVVGKRTRPHAVELVRELDRVSASMPALFSSDQLAAYPYALLQVYARLQRPPRRPGPGRPPKARLVPPDELCYVQVVKSYEGQRVVDVRRRVVFGDPERVERLLAGSSVSRTINTSHVERNNGTLRHIDARLNRKTYRFSKCKQNHKRQLALSLAYYHLCRPHRTLTADHQHPTTPFMAPGLTDHVWSMHELLRFRPEDACA